jgi:hypothetical protein
MTFVKMLLSAITMLWASPSFASSAQTIGSLAVNLTNQLPPYTSMISGFAYVMGTAFGISGIFKIKQHKESPQGSSSMGGPIFIMIGVFLLYLPTTVNYLYGTVFGSAESETGMTLYYSATLMDGTLTGNASVPT